MQYPIKKFPIHTATNLFRRNGILSFVFQQPLQCADHKEFSLIERLLNPVSSGSSSGFELYIPSTRDRKLGLIRVADRGTRSVPLFFVHRIGIELAR